MKARADVGFKDTPEEAKKNFIQYLVEDAILPGVDETLLIEPDNVVEGPAPAPAPPQLEAPVPLELESYVPYSDGGFEKVD